MMKWLTRIAIGIGGLLALIVLLVATLNVISMTRQRKTYTIDANALTLGPAARDIDRGRHLAEAVGGCTDCHAPDLGGRIVEDNAALGRLVSSNLTRGEGGLPVDYSEADWVRSIRHGVGRNGKSLIFMPSASFQSSSDDDVGSLIAYFRSIPPVDRTLPTTRIGPLARVLHLAVGFPLLAAEHVDHSARVRSVPPAGATAQYGEYLANVSGCRDCHAPMLTGANGPNITRGRIPWTEAEFINSMRDGKRPDGSAISEAMPWKVYGKMTDDELHALYAFIQTVPPVQEKK